MSKQTKNPLAAFAAHPAQIYFETQNPNEKIELMLRRHFVTNTGWIVLAVILSGLPFFRIQIAELLGVPDFGLLLPGSIFLLMMSAYNLLIIGFCLINLLRWYYTVFLVTNRRVLDVDLIGFLYRNIAEAELEEIQDVSHTQGGLGQIIFDYGSVFVQTAGTLQNIEMRKVPQPGKVHDIITDLQARVDRKKR